MQYVFVLDTDRVPQSPVHPAVARKLLSSQQAAVLRRYPFTIILKRTGYGSLFAQPCRLKIDPGSKTTGLALLQGNRVLWAAELSHRGQRITAALTSRKALRRNRRQRNTRYRPPRFDNRTRPTGWLPPSLQSRIANIMTWVERLTRYCPIGALSQELVRFDTQLMQNAEISGVEYQQGELQGYEVREYLLEKWGRKCAYCKATNIPLEVEHIVPKSRGGSNRVGNLTLACRPCNERKGKQTAAEFGYPEVQTKAKQSLKDAAAVNTTRWALYHLLRKTELAVEVGTGGRTKCNRIRLGLPKTHWLDAACVGESTPEMLCILIRQPLLIRSMGRGKRKRCQTDTFGFPKRHFYRKKRHFGFQTGDIVQAVIPQGKYMGRHRGRITVRQEPHVSLYKKSIHVKYLCLIHRADGYDYGVSLPLQLLPGMGTWHRANAPNGTTNGGLFCTPSLVPEEVHLFDTKLSPDHTGGAVEGTVRR